LIVPQLHELACKDKEALSRAISYTVFRGIRTDSKL